MKSSAGHCKSCGASGEWFESRANKRWALLELRRNDQLGNVAVDVDGYWYVVTPGEGQFVAHFYNCPQSQQWRDRAAAAGGS